MEVLILQVFVSLTLVAFGVLLFLHGMNAKDFEHADRLSLLPIEQDDAAKTVSHDRSVIEEKNASRS